MQEIGKKEGTWEKESERKRRGELVVSWWNGGGRLVPRMEVNPELKTYLETKPDIFVYGESLVYKPTRKVNIQGYKVIIHTAKRNELRRGLAIFYKEKHSHVITKDKGSKKFDILWIRMKIQSEDIIMGFFYAPGMNHDEGTRVAFYDELRIGIDTYIKENKRIYLMGDSNARLGEYTKDENIHGEKINNGNKKLFMGFLGYTGMVCLNRILAIGQPTYEIIGKKRSIIDVCLTNNMASIKSFQVLPQILGINAQTCHKILQLRIQAKQKTLQGTQKKVNKFRHCTYEALLKVKGEVAKRIRILKLIMRQRQPSETKPTMNRYAVLSKMYRSAKEKHIGYRKPGRRIVPESVVIRTLQEKINETTAMIEREKTRSRSRNTQNRTEMEVLVQRLTFLEKELYTQWENNQHRKFARWLDKLNTLDYHKATRTFYAEMRSKSRDSEHFGPIVDKQGQLSTSLEQCLENWRQFYADLYRGSDRNGNIDQEDCRESDEQQQHMNTSESNKLNKDITMEEVVNAIFTLKANTAAGKDSILSRDFIELMNTELVSEYENTREIMKFLHQTLSTLWKKKKVPSGLKESVIRPFLKNIEKDQTDPTNYRPVSLLNTTMKVYEQIIKERLVTMLEKRRFFTELQAAYRKGRSTVDHLLVLQEIFYHYRYTRNGSKQRWKKKALYYAFMDLRKAFDTVPRRKLFQKLRRAGVTGNMLAVIKDLYTNNRATVRIGNFESEYFWINSGVMQGSKLGPILFNIFINDLLQQLHNSQRGVELGEGVISALGFADDIVLIADTPAQLQVLIDICGTWSINNGMSFNNDKCKILVLNASKKDHSFKLLGKEVEIVKMVKYLGVLLSRSRQTSLYTSHISKMIAKAETRVNSIRHMGFHSDGLRPETSTRMYKILVRPIMEYAAQVLSYKHYYFKERECTELEEPSSIIKRLEKFQNKVLKQLITCPKTTPPALLRLMTGTMPIRGRIEMLKLRYFWKLHHSSKENLANRIYKYKRENFLQSNVGFVHEVFDLCCKFGRMDLWHGVCPNKTNPYTMIKKIVEAYYYRRDIETAQKSQCAYTSLTVLFNRGNLQTTTFPKEMYKLDSRLKEIGRFRNSEHRRLFLYAFLDTGAYIRECKHCGESMKDTVAHYLEECTAIEHQRNVFRTTMRFYKVPKTANLRNKVTVFSLALSKKYLLKTFCEFLKELRD